MTVRTFLGAASVLALMVAPVSVLADEAGGALEDERLGAWFWGDSAVSGVTNGALATVAVAAGVGLGFAVAELAESDSSTSSSSTSP